MVSKDDDDNVVLADDKYNITTATEACWITPHSNKLLCTCNDLTLIFLYRT